MNEKTSGAGSVVGAIMAVKAKQQNDTSSQKGANQDVLVRIMEKLSKKQDKKSAK